MSAVPWVIDVSAVVAFSVFFTTSSGSAASVAAGTAIVAATAPAAPAAASRSARLERGAVVYTGSVIVSLQRMHAVPQPLREIVARAAH